MNVEETHLKDCLIVSPRVITDERGCFFESFNKKAFYELTGISVDFVQDNQSKSSKGVLRGLHFQTGAFEQAKLVRVVKGKVLDVAVDLRKQSPSFGQHLSIVLDDIDNKQLYIPRGFAHGFLVLEDETLVSYKCDNYYNKSFESGIIYNDKTLNIDWNFSSDQLILSEKDMRLPTFKMALK